MSRTSSEQSTPRGAGPPQARVEPRHIVSRDSSEPCRAPSHIRSTVRLPRRPTPTRPEKNQLLLRSRRTTRTTTATAARAECLLLTDSLNLERGCYLQYHAGSLASYLEVGVLPGEVMRSQQIEVKTVVNETSRPTQSFLRALSAGVRRRGARGAPCRYLPLPQRTGAHPASAALQLAISRQVPRALRRPAPRSRSIFENFVRRGRACSRG